VACGQITNRADRVYGVVPITPVDEQRSHGELCCSLCRSTVKLRNHLASKFLCRNPSDLAPSKPRLISKMGGRTRGQAVLVFAGLDAVGGGVTERLEDEGLGAPAHTCSTSPWRRRERACSLATV
jgi:hypothetical protein